MSGGELPAARAMLSSLVALLLVLGFPRNAAAHADLDPLHDHRVLAVHVTDEGIALTYILALSAETSRELRNRFDADGDGRLSDVERARVGADAERWAEGLALYLDDEKIALGSAPSSVEGLAGRGEGSGELAVRFAKTVRPRREGEHVLRLSDATRLARPGDLHLRLSAEGKSRVLAVDRRAEARVSYLEVAFHRADACQATACEAEVKVAGGGQPALSWWLFALASVGIVALGAAAIGVMERRRSRGDPASATSRVTRS